MATATTMTTTRKTGEEEMVVRGQEDGTLICAFAGGKMKLWYDLIIFPYSGYVNSNRVDSFLLKPEKMQNMHCTSTKTLF